jgi:hypothetical protein
MVEPGATEVPEVGTSVLVTVKFGAVTEKHSLASAVPLVLSLDVT